MPRYIQPCVMKGFKPRREVVGTIESITFYPLKSAKGIKVDTVECLPTGLKLKDEDIYDRHWVVVDTALNNQFVTGKDEAIITSVQPSFHGSKLHLDVNNMKTLKIPKVVKSSMIIEAKFKAEYVKGVDCGDKAANWFSSLFGRSGFRLIYFGKKTTHRRLMDQHDDPWFRTAKPSDQIAYQNYTAFNLIGQESLRDLNERLPEKRGKITMDQFRPNFVITGCPAYDEDHWKNIYIGESTFFNLKPRNVCLLTVVDPKDGTVREDQEPMTTLRSYRLVIPDFKNAPAFGIQLVGEKPGVVRVGDNVYATRSSVPPNNNSEAPKGYC